MYDVDAIRRDFPLLQKKMRGKPFVYLDSGATALKPEAVLRTALEYYEDYGVNIHRGVYEFSDRATRLFQEARETVARFINAPSDAEVIFTHGATESSNLIASSWGRKFLKPGDVILTTEMEHHSNLVPWQAVAQATGARLDFIPLDPESLELDLSNLDRQLAAGVKVVVLTAMSNVTGYQPPLESIIPVAHRHGALVVVDGAQYVPHHPCDVQALDCDFLFFSGHKMLAPTGIGVLYARRQVLEAMDPFLYGGDMIREVRALESTYQGIPEKFEAGTPHISGALALGAAIGYLEGVGLPAVVDHVHGLLDYCLDRARDCPWIETYVPRDSRRRGGVFSFNLKGIHPHDAGTILDSQGIAVRTGFHCAMPFMNRLGVGGTVRASFYLYTCRADIDALFRGLEQTRQLFG